MKTRVPRQEFLDALTAIATVATARTPKPILAGVLLAVGDGAVHLTGTDGETSLRVIVSALTVDKPGRTVVSAERLLSIVREMPDVELLLTSDDRHLTVRGAGSELKIFVQNPDDFPPTPEPDESPDLIIDGAQLARMISLTGYAAARETSRYAINGILWEKEGKRLFLVATDGRRLARAGGNVQESRSGDFQAIVPAKALSVFERVFTAPRGGDPWTVEVKVQPNLITLRSGDRLLATALVEGHFPKYQDVIPREGDRRARLDRVELLSAVRRAALLTTDESRAVRLSFEKDTLVITSNSPEQGEARVELPMSFEGKPLAIAFNPSFLIDPLKVAPQENLCIELSESARPGVVYGDDRTEFLYVLMPVQI